MVILLKVPREKEVTIESEDFNESRLHKLKREPDEPTLEEIKTHFAQNHVPARKRSAAADHVLVGATDVGGHNLEDRAVLALALLPLADDRAGGAVELELGERDALDLDVIAAHEDNTTVLRLVGHRREIALGDRLAGQGSELACGAACDKRMIIVANEVDLK